MRAMLNRTQSKTIHSPTLNKYRQIVIFRFIQKESFT